MKLTGSATWRLPFLFPFCAPPRPLVQLTQANGAVFRASGADGCAADRVNVSELRAGALGGTTRRQTTPPRA